MASLSREEQDRLVEAAQEGRHGAFEHLYELTHARVFTLAARVVGDREEAADITQEVYLDVLRQLPAESRHIRLEPWLFRLTMNTSYDHLRRRAARAAAPLSEDLCAATSDHLERAQIAALLTQTLAGLTPRYRTAVVLRDICGASTDELADVMGISRGSAAVVLFRARAAFRRVFRELAPAEVASLSAVMLLREAPEPTPPPRLAQAPSPSATLHAAADPAAGPLAPHLPLATPADCAAMTSPPGSAGPEPCLWSSLAPVADLGSTVAAKVAVLAVTVATVVAGGALTTGATDQTWTPATAAAPAAMTATAPFAGGSGGGGAAPGPLEEGTSVSGATAGATAVAAGGAGLADGPTDGLADGAGTGGVTGTPGGTTVPAGGATESTGVAPDAHEPGAGPGSETDDGAGTGGGAGAGGGEPQGAGTGPPGQGSGQPGQTPPDAGGAPGGSQDGGEQGDAGAGGGTAATDAGPSDAPGPAAPDPAGAGGSAGSGGAGSDEGGGDTDGGTGGRH